MLDHQSNFVCDSIVLLASLPFLRKQGRVFLYYRYLGDRHLEVRRCGNARFEGMDALAHVLVYLSPNLQSDYDGKLIGKLQIGSKL